MIPKASQRGGGQDLATHLLNDYDNEMTQVVEVRGAVARDLHGAFKEWEFQADALTRCDNYLYSMSLNPDPAQGPLTRDQYMDYIQRAETTLGLSDQPRAVVFHVKEGREHCHVVWSRIDAENEKAVHLAFDHDKLMRVTRAFARDHGLGLPEGYEKSRQAGQISLYEQEQIRQTGVSKADHKELVTDAWRSSDSPKAFVQALAERGYVLATGRRPYVLVDIYGNENSLPKLIDDKSIRTKDIRAFLEKDYPLESLPSVEEAKKLVAEHRKTIERTVQDNQYADALDHLKRAQQDRRRDVESERDELQTRQQLDRMERHTTHKAEREDLRREHKAKMKVIRSDRYDNRATGLAAFLGRISGFAILQKALHRHQDRKQTKSYVEKRDTLKDRQVREMRDVEFRDKVQALEVGRKIKSLDKLDKRELAALARDHRTFERVQTRGEDGAMPSLAKLRGFEEQARDTGLPDVMSMFSRARDGHSAPPPDLISAFRQASKDQEDAGKDSSDGKAWDRAKPPEIKGNDPGKKGPGRGDT